MAGWGFAGPSLLRRLRLEEPVVALENPMSEEESILRPTLLGSLLDAARHNRSHGAHALALFEAGHVYRPGTSGALGVRPAPADERDALGAVVVGPLAAPAWRTSRPPAADVFTAKALVGAVLDALRVEWEAVPAARPFLHPGRASGVRVDGAEIGWFGEVHPPVSR